MTAAPGGSPPMSIYSTPSPSAPEVSHFTSDADSAGHNLKPARSYGRLTQLISGNGARARSRSSSIGSQGAGSGIADEGMTRTRSKENHVQITSRPVSRSEARKSGRAASAALLATDARYKRYSVQIERCLATFSEVTEWADFIAFLSRLLKALQSTTPSYSELPFKLTIAKRLAQGLNPALPNGVHQRSLDVYREIFRMIGMEALHRDLQIWSSGLFPFFQYASTSVRPTLLDIYETFYLPLGRNLRPVGKALTLALLPGIEEETGDFFDRVMILLDRLSQSLEPQFLYQCLFLILMTSPTSRPAALNYLLRRLPNEMKENKDESKLVDGLTGVIGLDGGLFLRGLASALDDDSVLVQRAVLDLLIAALSVRQLAENSDFETLDKQLLANSACSVVLRRDLSISRRLYTWLLGSDEAPERQMEYFRTFGLEIVQKALQSEMARMTELDVDPLLAARPYKVFVSLLDKGEIGLPLSRGLALPALQSLEQAASSASVNGGDIAVATARTIYESVEPQIVWSALYRTIQEETSQGELKAAELAIWILKSCSSHDEEVVTIHAPLMLHMITFYLERKFSKSSELAMPSSSVFLSLLNLATRLVVIIPSGRWSTGAISESVECKSATSYAQDLYATVAGSAAQALHENREFCDWSTCYQDILDHAMQLFQNVFPEGGLFLAVVDLLGAVLDSFQPSNGKAPIWDGVAWRKSALKKLSNAESFQVGKCLVLHILRIHSSSLSRQQRVFIGRKAISDMVATLAKFLTVDRTLCHAEVSRLIWELDESTSQGVLRDFVAQLLTEEVHWKLRSNLSSISVLWRHAVESDHALDVMHVSVLWALNALQASDGAVRGYASTWLRDIPSFNLAMGILIRGLSGSKYERSKDNAIIQGREVPRWTFSAEIDSDHACHLLDCTINLLQYGDDRVISQAVISMPKDDPLSAHVQKSFGAKSPSIGSYLDLLVVAILGLVETRQILVNCLRDMDVRIKALAALHELVQIAELGETSRQATERVVTQQLFTAVHDGDLDGQTLLLQILQISLLRPLESRPSLDVTSNHRRSISDGDKSGLKRVSVSDNNTSMLLQAILFGLSAPSSKPIVHLWTDFVLDTSTFFQHGLKPLLFPICDCLCDELWRAIDRSRNLTAESKCSVSSVELFSYVTALEQLVELAVRGKRRGSISENGRPVPDHNGFLGYVSGVFAGEQAPTVSSIDTPRCAGLQVMVRVFKLLVDVWDATEDASPALDSILDSVTKEAIVDASQKCFQLDPRRCTEALSEALQEKTPEAVSRIVSGLVDKIATASHISDIVSLTVTDYVSGDQKSHRDAQLKSCRRSLDFLAEYLQRLEAPIAVQIWPVTSSMVRDTLQSSTQGVKQQLALDLLKTYTLLCKKVVQTHALNDKRLKRDLQDTFMKVLEASLFSIAALPRSAEETEKAHGGKVSSEKALGNAVKAPPQLEYSQAINFLLVEVLPNIKAFLPDDDKVTNACQLISNAVVLPAFRGKSKMNAVDLETLEILSAMSSMPQAARVWRGFAAEILLENNLMDVPRSIRGPWSRLLATLIDQDRERFPELLQRAAAPMSTGIFANKDAELHTRAMNIRKLSFALFAAERNHFIVQLPGVQEKLVDLLRSASTSPMVQAEVFLCLRVIICRFSEGHLRNFWPIILAELFRVFEDATEDLLRNTPLQLVVLLAGCKLLDLMLVLQTEDFQIHQWMFVTDTVDASYPPDDWTPESIVDRLADLISDHRRRLTTSPMERQEAQIFLPDLRRPLLAQTTSIKSVDELEDFVSHASIVAYEATYKRLDIDWSFIEAKLEQEIFSGLD